MNCFCGCGSKVPRLPLGLRSINKRGRRIGKDVAMIETLLQQGLRSPNAEAFVEDGRAIMGELAHAVHTRSDPGSQVEAESRDFMRRARERFVTGRIGQSARRAGLSADQAAAAMTRGEFDPFAYTQGQETIAELVHDTNAHLADIPAKDEIAQERGLQRQSFPQEDGPYVCHYQTPRGVEDLDPIIVPNLALARLAPAVFAQSCSVDSPFLRPRANDEVELVPDDNLGPEGGMVAVAPGYTIAIRRATDAEAETLPCPFSEDPKGPLLEASDRLDDHLLDGPFDSYLKLVLLACSAAAYGTLRRFAISRSEDDADPHPDTLQLIAALDEPAAADRAVRSATWMVFGNVIAQQWPERWQEIVDLVTAAMPLSPAGLAAAAAHIDECIERNTRHASDADEDVAANDELDDGEVVQNLIEVAMLFRSTFHWLLTSVMQWSADEVDPALTGDAIDWGCELVSGFNDYVDHLDELEAQNPDVVP